MDKNVFWKLIEDARDAAEDSGNVAEHVVKSLLRYSPEQIIHWHCILNCYQELSYKNKLWAAAYVINGGCSDDGFDYFRGWLIAAGRETFVRALEDPDSLADAEVQFDTAENEDMLSAGPTAYLRQVGLDEADYDAFAEACDRHALTDAEITEIEAGIHFAADINAIWEESSLETVVPRLTARFY